MGAVLSISFKLISPSFIFFALIGNPYTFPTFVWIMNMRIDISLRISYSRISNMFMNTAALLLVSQVWSFGRHLNLNYWVLISSPLWYIPLFCAIHEISKSYLTLSVPHQSLMEIQSHWSLTQIYLLGRHEKKELFHKTIICLVTLFSSY